MVKKVFLLHGKAQSGKNYCADIMKALCETKGEKVLTIAFADWVKDCLRRYYGIEDYKSEWGRSNITHFATDICRKNDPDIWARVVATTVKAMESEWDIVLIPDWRFENESEVMERYFPNKVVKVLITRPDVNNVDKMTEKQREHQSETELDNWENFDYNILNEYGKLENIYKQLIDMIEREEVSFEKKK